MTMDDEPPPHGAAAGHRRGRDVLNAAGGLVQGGLDALAHQHSKIRLIPFAVAAAVLGGRHLRDAGVGLDARGEEDTSRSQLKPRLVKRRGRSGVEAEPEGLEPTAGQVKDKAVRQHVAAASASERGLKPREAQLQYERALALVPEGDASMQALLEMRVSKSISDQCFEAWEKPEKYGWAREQAEMALHISQRTLDSAPPEMQAHAHLIHAVNLGRLAMFSEPRAKVRLAREVKEMLEVSMRLDSGLDLTHHALGVWHREMAGVNWMVRVLVKVLFNAEMHPGSYEQALAHFGRAAELNPGKGIHHIEMGKTYAKLHKPEQVLSCLQIGIAAPVEDILDHYIQQDGLELLKETKRKGKGLSK